MSAEHAEKARALRLLLVVEEETDSGWKPSAEAGARTLLTMGDAGDIAAAIRAALTGGAAPDMLEALRQIERRLQESAGGGRTPASRASLRGLARAAIAAATGEGGAS